MKNPRLCYAARMSSWRLGVGAALVVFLSVNAVAQVPPTGRPVGTRAGRPGVQGRTMYDVLAAMPWDLAKDGPLVAPIPIRMMPGTSLDDFNRKRASVGALTAIVPKTMATIDSKFIDAPNMYEGLPEEAKVLYLMRSLTPAQWQIATTGGISLADCRGEQAAVFDSILPNPLRYSMGTVNDGRSISGPRRVPDIKTLTDAERKQVKIRIVRNLHAQVAMEGGGYTMTEPEGELKPGTQMPLIQKEGDSEFGHRVIVRGPNVPRKSQLDLSGTRFDAKVTFADRERLKELLQRISTATGVKLAADPHYANDLMLEKGEGATARDLLGALCLGVAGTYRKVGDTYLLTADLEGVGAQIARVAAWEDALKKVVDARTAEWRSELAKNGRVGKIPVDSPFFSGLTPAEQASLEANDKPHNEYSYLPIGQASKPFRDAILNYRFGNRIDKEKVGVSSSVRYQIVIPQVGRGWWQGWIGNADQFETNPYAWAPPNPAPVAMPLDPKKAVTGLVLHADTAAEAKKQVARVAKLKIAELWLETSSGQALAAAVEAGAAANVKVVLAARPWVTAPLEAIADPDRTIAGEHGSSLATAKAEFGSLKNLFEELEAFEPPTRELVAPLDPATKAHISAVQSLAATKGLFKIALLDLYPAGYALKDSNMGGSYWYSIPVEHYLGYGYTESQRLAHLRAEGVDPIDLQSQFIRNEINFGPIWGEDFTYGQGFEKWQAAKGKWSHDRVLALAQAVRAANPNVVMPGEPQANHMPPLAETSLYRLDPTPDLPAAPMDFGGGEVPENAVAQLIELVDDRDPAQRNRVADRLRKLFAGPPKPLVLDFSSVPATRIDAVLGRWLKRGE